MKGASKIARPHPTGMLTPAGNLITRWKQRDRQQRVERTLQGTHYTKPNLFSYDLIASDAATSGAPRRSSKWSKHSDFHCISHEERRLLGHNVANTDPTATIERTLRRRPDFADNVLLYGARIQALNNGTYHKQLAHRGSQQNFVLLLPHPAACVEAVHDKDSLGKSYPEDFVRNICSGNADASQQIEIISVGFPSEQQRADLRERRSLNLPQGYTVEKV